LVFEVAAPAYHVVEFALEDFGLFVPVDFVESLLVETVYEGIFEICAEKASEVLVSVWVLWNIFRFGHAQTFHGAFESFVLELALLGIRSGLHSESHGRLRTDTHRLLLVEQLLSRNQVCGFVIF